MQTSLVSSSHRLVQDDGHLHRQSCQCASWWVLAPAVLLARQHLQTDVQGSDRLLRALCSLQCSLQSCSHRVTETVGIKILNYSNKSQCIHDLKLFTVQEITILGTRQAFANEFNWSKQEINKFVRVLKTNRNTCRCKHGLFCWFNIVRDFANIKLNSAWFI